MLNLGWLAKTGSCKAFNTGKSITGAGVSGLSARAAYILISGRVDVFEANKEVGTPPMGVVLPGDVFGGREFFTGETECVYKAGVDCVAFIITADSFVNIARKNPEVLFEVLKAAYTPLGRPSEQLNAPDAQQSKSETETNEEQDTNEANGADVKTVKEIIASIPISGSFFPENHKLYPGIVKPEYSNLVYPKEYECPFCGSSFSDYRISNSKLYEAAPARYDLRRYYNEFQTEWYEIVTCPQCFFSMFQTYFTEPKPLKKEKIENGLIDARETVILRFDEERDIDFVFTAHYLALLCSEGYASSVRQLRAKLWGNLSWLYEDVEDEEMMKFSAEKAAEAYETVYKETPVTPVQEQVICLSIAGMQYRAGIDRDMKRYLFAAKTSKAGNRVYNSLADDFMEKLSTQDVQEEQTSQEDVPKTGKKKK